MRREYTVFVDESGLFSAGAVGHRVVGAVVVPLAREEADGRARAALEAGAGPWGLPVHAKDLVSPLLTPPRALTEARWQLLQSWMREGDRPRVPDRATLLALQDGSRGMLLGALSREPGRHADRVLYRLRVEVRRLLRETGAWLVWVGEHGRRALEAGDRDHWPRMVRAAVGQAAVSVWRAGGEGASITPVIATYSSLATLDLAPTQRALSTTTRVAPIWPEAQVPLIPAETSAGLQVADVLVHALGPGAAQSLPVASPDRHTMRDLQCNFWRLFPAPQNPVYPPPYPAPCSGATEDTHGRVMAAFSTGDPMVVPRLEALLGRPPANTLAYGVEGALVAARALCEKAP